MPSVAVLQKLMRSVTGLAPLAVAGICYGYAHVRPAATRFEAASVWRAVMAVIRSLRSVTWATD
jgi:hypothetical protein